MTRVDPFVERIPQKILDDPELAPYFTYLDLHLHDAWIRSGGGDDAIAESQIGELYEPGIQTSNTDEHIEELEVSAEMPFILDLLERVESLEAANQNSLDLSERIEELESTIEQVISTFDDTVEIITIATGDTAFTTTGNQTIICNNTAALTITLNLLPDDGEKITVIRRDAAVSLVGTLNGSTPTPIPSQYDVLDVEFTLAAGEWSA